VNKERLQRNTYIDRVSDKQQWFYKADGLLHAASFLKAEVQRFYDCLQRPPDQVDIQAIRDDRLVEVYFMLVGCAFENLLKGVHIQRLKTTPIKGPKLPPEIKTHNVLCLAQKLGMKLGRREEDLLKRLEITVVWRARYPVPTDYSQIIPFVEKPDDLRIAESVLAKLRKLQSDEISSQRP
jgi:hypothetical protein